MRALAILIILAVVGFFGYQYAVEGRGPNAAIGVLTGATAAAEQAAAEEAAAAAAAEAAAEEAAAAEAAAAEAAAAEAEAQAAAEAEAQAAAEAEAAAAAVQEALDEAAAATESAIESTTNALEETTADLTASAEELLTVENFNIDSVIALIEGSDLNEQEKTTLTNAVRAAQNSPALLQPVLERARQLLAE